MKTILLLLAFSSIVFADDLEQRVLELENKTLAMQAAMEQKLGNCQMVYLHHSYRLNLCDKGTFVRGIVPVGNNANQLECGYYQLRCSRDANEHNEHNGK
jgi:hypothetical protein